MILQFIDKEPARKRSHGDDFRMGLYSRELPPARNEKLKKVDVGAEVYWSVGLN
jgi:hypothetical protein